MRLLLSEINIYRIRNLHSIEFLFYFKTDEVICTGGILLDPILDYPILDPVYDILSNWPFRKVMEQR